jgi:hypothetical protein
MKTQEIINAISVLSACIDSLNRSGQKEDITIVVNKVLELVAKL